VTADDLAAVNERIESLITELETHPDPEIAPRVHDLVRSLCGLFGAGFARVLALTGAHPGGGQPLVNRLAEDPLIGSLLLLNDQHPQDLQHRLTATLERLRPYAAMRGASVSLLAVEGTRVRLQVTAATPSGGQAAADVEHEARAVLEAAAPEITDLEFEHPAEPLPLIQITRPRHDTTPRDTA
jgi:hypothetical protein